MSVLGFVGEFFRDEESFIETVNGKRVTYLKMNGRIVPAAEYPGLSVPPSRFDLWQIEKDETLAPGGVPGVDALATQAGVIAAVSLSGIATESGSNNAPQGDSIAAVSGQWVMANSVTGESWTLDGLDILTTGVTSLSSVERVYQVGARAFAVNDANLFQFLGGAWVLKHAASQPIQTVWGDDQTCWFADGAMVYSLIDGNPVSSGAVVTDFQQAATGNGIHLATDSGRVHRSGDPLGTWTATLETGSALAFWRGSFYLGNGNRIRRSYDGLVWVDVPSAFHVPGDGVAAFAMHQNKIFGVSDSGVICMMEDDPNYITLPDRPGYYLVGKVQ